MNVIGMNGKNIILRVDMNVEQVDFGKLATIIAEESGDLVAIDVIHTTATHTVRDLTINVRNLQQGDKIIRKLKELKGVNIIHVSDRTFLLHLGGKIEISPKTRIQNRDDLSNVYTPEVSRVCMAIAEDASKAFNLTIKKNTVAVVTDGSAVLGLGNIGPAAAAPVMEGKAMLFKQFAGVDAFPICLNTQNTDEIIRAIEWIAPIFGGINLEDISAPRCFEIEQKLQERLDIPVFHDDQHGTAVVLYAGLINALKVVNKSIDNIKIVVCGMGAAGLACSKILLAAGAKNIIGVDKEGALTVDKTYENPHWQWFAEHTNPDRLSGSLQEIIRGADVFIGLSTGGVLTRQDVLNMADQPIIFAMANPQPEILPEEIEDIAGVIATGRSDYPNQINNVLSFPGIFRGALDCRATTINEVMKLAAAEAIASVITEETRNKQHIIPSVFNQNVVPLIRERVIEAAVRSGAARKIPRGFVRA